MNTNQKALSPESRAYAAAIFSTAPFIQELGIELVDIGAGRIESRLLILPKHLQQNGFVHAGVTATMADHSAGAAAGTLSAPGKKVLTVEFKINLLRPAIGQVLRCNAIVLKPGRTISFVESEVFAINEDTEKLIAKSSVTLAMVD